MRKDWDTYFLDIAETVSKRSTCDRLHVGCVIVKDKHIVSTGYNGSIKGHDHCDDVGHLLNEENRCIRTIHAEQNAIIFADRDELDGATAYVTHEPCETCTKLLIQSGIKRIVFRHTYKNKNNFHFIKNVSWEHFPRSKRKGGNGMKPKRVQFMVDAKKYFEDDANSLEKVEDGDVCLVTIDFENQTANYIWYNSNAADAVNRNPANFPAEEDDFDTVVQLWEELGKPGSEPNIIERKENFPIDGEAYIVGEQMGRHFFAWGPRYPFADELPEEDITNGESGIQWFETEEEALQEYLDAIDAIK